MTMLAAATMGSAARHGAVSTSACESDRGVVGRCHRSTFAKDKIALGHPGHVVHGKYGIARKALEQAIGDHSQGATASFFCWLENQIQGAVKVAGMRQMVCCSHEHGSVPIVSASMHHAAMDTGPCHTTGLVDGQCIHVGTQA
jgi:hypothetical protein